ncbi:MAG: 16S rRNA (adenine(1518)-N(6)/adenine(1519)-N(6))-dimethyltransferase RsmA [Burkholderiaceae bacterium]|nr:MAG: 16S rRNA (adenine(1518)-N(6)/adenine(1519)-N(6))-dimethyltransferase RsmA [Burkholderiaceae bacterium]
MKHIPRKRFGQNFLTDAGVIDAIVRAIDPQPGEVMVEIGPGQAAMTRPVLQRLGQLQVVEIDRDLVALLQKKFPADQLIVHQADALQFDFGQLAPQGGQLRIIGNLPYNISSPLLFHLMGFAAKVRDQHFMLQKEVVERMVAQPGSKDFSRLTVMLQARYAMDMLFEVPPTAFDPPPKVDSAIVRMIPLPADQQQVTDWECLAEVVTQAFSQRRKMLRNTLGTLAKEIDLVALGVDLQARAEDIPVATYIAVANHLHEQRT